MKTSSLEEYLLWHALAGSMPTLLFDPEDEGNTLLRNVGQVLPDYTT
jgi:hypothetical protein